MRMGFFYIPHGAIMGNTSHGPEHGQVDAERCRCDFKLSPILKSLEPYKKCVTSFGEPQNQAMVGGVQVRPGHVAQRPPAGQGVGRGQHGDDSRSDRRAEHRPEHDAPSLEVSSETPQQAAACGGSACFYNTTLSFRDAHSPLPMEFNPRKVFAMLFGEGDTPEERAPRFRTRREACWIASPATRAPSSAIWARTITGVLDAYLETVREIERR